MRWFVSLFLIILNGARGEVYSMRLQSSSFIHQSTIPGRYTCTGDNLSPPLNWSGAPQEAKSFVLICDDPDAPGKTWDHWILYNIPSSTTEIKEGDSAGMGGINSWNQEGYGSPCPPSGEHRYFFKLYALDTTLSFNEPPSKHKIEQSMKGHILATAELVGRVRKS